MLTGNLPVGNKLIRLHMVAARQESEIEDEEEGEDED